MGSVESTLDSYREFTSWMAVIPALTVFLATFLSSRLTLVSRELGATLSVIFMFIVLFIFITSERYVKQMVFSDTLDQDEIISLYRKSAYLSGILIPLVGFISAVLVGYPDSSFTALSFMIIGLSGLGSAWKRFYDKMTGKLTIPRGGSSESGTGRKKEKK